MFNDTKSDCSISVECWHMVRTHGHEGVGELKSSWRVNAGEACVHGMRETVGVYIGTSQ